MTDSLPQKSNHKLTFKLSILFIIGLIELVALIIIFNNQPGFLKLGNTYTFPVGNMKFSLNAPKCSRVTTERKKLDSLGMQRSIIMIENIDTTQPSAQVSVSIAGLVDSCNLLQIDSILKTNSNLEILNTSISKDALDAELINKNQSSKIIVIFRFLKVYPYIMKIQSAYNKDIGKTAFIDSVFNSIGVRR